LSNLPVILIEVVLVFGGVLAFGIWQLRALKKQMKPKDQAAKPDNGQTGGNSKT
jgi:hypothetical protein